MTSPGLSDTTVLAIYRNILKYRYCDVLLFTLKPAENFSEMRVYTIWPRMTTPGG